MMYEIPHELWPTDVVKAVAELHRVIFDSTDWRGAQITLDNLRTSENPPSIHVLV